MPIKVHELAKELNLNSKDLLDKIASMGIDAKSHMSVLSDIDAIAVRNTITRAKTKQESKIVKVTPKKVDTSAAEEPRVVVKAAAKPIQQTQPAQKAAVRKETRPVTQRPPIGKPIVSKDIEGRPRPPIGKPIVSKDLDNRGSEPVRAGEPKVKPAETEAAPAVKEAAAAKKAAAAPADAAKPEVKADVKPEVNETAAKKTETKAASAADGKEAAAKAEKAEKAAAKTAAETKPAEDDAKVSAPAETGQTFKIVARAADIEAAEKARAEKAAAARTAQPQRPARPAGDRPARPSGDRGPRRDGDRPARPAGDRGPRRDGDRPARPGAPRPAGASAGPRRDGDRPARPAGERRSFDRPSAPGAAPAKGGSQKKSDKSQRDHEQRDKFSRLEGGKGRQGKNDYQDRSLEKQAKPKKHQKVSKQVEEPAIDLEALPAGTKVINVPITVAGFCEQTEISTSQVIMALMKMGVMANINQNIDEDTVLILAEELGISVVIGNVEQEEAEEGIETFEDKEEDLKPRPPIITVMGHVDHGKTSLLDAIRKTNVTSSEAGGITQHIGASEVTINGQKIVFLDTPGHEAFTAMRARGAHVTDIAVLVVAADDSVKPQTVESISHAKAAGVPIIVAINKIDKPGANPDRVKQDLTEHGILVEEWGGDTICVPVSAKTGEGITSLLEMILLQAEVLELKANPNRLASGSVIEARLDKNKGPVATLLVMNGTLQAGQSIVAGTCAGKIRLMTNYKGDTIRKAGPATAVEILGLTEVPEAGDEFNAVKEDRIAREIAENRRIKLREEVLARNASTTLEQLFSQIKEGETKELNLIIKGDVMGSVGAIVSSLEKLQNENVRVKIIHTGVGTVTESDVMLAGTAGAVIIGFNVRPSTAVTNMAERENIQIRTYRVIYDVIDDVEAAMKGMLDPVYQEVVLGKLEIRDTFKVPNVGIVGGAYVTEGKVVRNAEIRLVRDGIVIHEGKISSLKRFKDDAKEVAQGYECGIGIESYNDIKEGDVIECFTMEEIKRD